MKRLNIFPYYYHDSEILVDDLMVSASAIPSLIYHNKILNEGSDTKMSHISKPLYAYKYVLSQENFSEADCALLPIPASMVLKIIALVLILVTPIISTLEYSSFHLNDRSYN